MKHAVGLHIIKRIISEEHGQKFKDMLYEHFVPPAHYVPKVDAKTLRDLQNKVRQITVWRRLSKYNAIDRLVGEIKQNFSLRQVALLTNTTWSNFLWRCTRPNVKGSRLVTAKQKQAVLATFTRNDVSMQLPYRRQANNHYLRQSVEETYNNTYVPEQTAAKERILSLSSVRRSLTKHIKPMKKVPYRHCQCGRCLNFGLLVEGVRASGLKGISRHSTKNVTSSLCPPRDCHSDGHDGHDDQSPLENYHRKCIFRECSLCGESQFYDNLKKKNGGMLDMEKTCHWRQWEDVFRDGKKIDHDRVKHTTTLEKLLKKYWVSLKKHSTHLFHFKWQGAQFEQVRNNLEDGDLLMVMDFGMNFAHRYAEEPQASHWYHQSSTVHPVVCYLRCPERDCHEIVTEDLMMISDDLNHDAYAVKAFEDKAIEHLQDKGYELKRVVQFTDNCSGQYKSKLPFEFLSERPFPIIRNYFGQQHGKGPGDALIGRISRRVGDHNRSGKSDIGDSRTMHQYLVEEMSITTVTGQCSHNVRYFYLVDDIDRSHVPQAVTLSGTQKVHSVRNTGFYGFVEVRDSSCFCSGCVSGDVPCEQSELVQGFMRHNIIGKKQEGDPSHSSTTWPDNAAKKQGKTKKPRKPRGKKKKPIVAVPEENITEDVSDDDAPEDVDNVDDHALGYGHDDHVQAVTDPVLAAFHNTLTEAHYLGMLNEMSMLTSWKSLLDYVRTYVEYVPVLPDTFFDARHTLDTEDILSRSVIPVDVRIGMNTWFCISTSADGNCLPHVLSRYCYGHEGHASEMRVRMVFEGVLNHRDYVDSGLLVKGSCFAETDVARLYAERTGQNLIGLDLSLPESVLGVFQLEMIDCCKAGTYCGLWALHVAANVLQRPINAWYPDIAEPELMPVRDFLHRAIEPFNAFHSPNPPATILWTKVSQQSLAFQHFVPVVP
jgi:hypothetical protein